MKPDSPQSTERKAAPYINLVIASGQDAGTRRRLIAELSNAFTDILESRPQDVRAMLWEVPSENLGEGGAEPGPRQTNNITALVAEGRSPEVLDAWCGAAAR